MIRFIQAVKFYHSGALVSHSSNICVSISASPRLPNRREKRYVFAHPVLPECFKNMLTVEPTTLPGVLILTPRRFADARGFFSESWNRARMRGYGIDIEFVQDNHSLSRQVGTIRGLHFQTPPHAQAKLVRCGRGRLFDVAVDIRRGSPTYGRWIGVELSFENGKQLLIPEGFAHGFITREPETEVIYKCSSHFAPECDGAVRFDDPAIAIDWGFDTGQAVLSDKDRAAPLLAEIDNPFVYEG